MSILSDFVRGKTSLSDTVSNLGDYFADIDRARINALEGFAEGVIDSVGETGDFIQSGLNGIGLEEIEITRLTDRAEASLYRSLEVVKSAGKFTSEFADPDLFTDFDQWQQDNIKSLKRLSDQAVGFTLEEIFNFYKLPRTLTDREKSVARSVYGDSINLDLVRIDDLAITTLADSLFSEGNLENPRPFVSFYTINTFGSLDDATLIHELAHVWQFDNIGVEYAPQAVLAQMDGPIRGKYPEYIVDRDDPFGGYIDGYGYGGYTELQRRKNSNQGLGSFNLEQEAEILSHLLPAST